MGCPGFFFVKFVLVANPALGIANPALGIELVVSPAQTSLEFVTEGVADIMLGYDHYDNYNNSDQLNINSFDPLLCFIPPLPLTF